MFTVQRKVCTQEAKVQVVKVRTFLGLKSCVISYICLLKISRLHVFPKNMLSQHQTIFLISLSVKCCKFWFERLAAGWEVEFLLVSHL